MKSETAAKAAADNAAAIGEAGTAIDSLPEADALALTDKAALTAAAGKVDAIPQAAIHKNGDQPHQNKKRRQTVGIMPHTYEIYFCLLAEYMKTHARTPRILKLEIHPTTDTHQPGG